MDTTTKALDSLREAQRLAEKAQLDGIRVVSRAIDLGRELEQSIQHLEQKCRKPAN